jgi:ectoine hydroxylase-related dioxygenase (phytanoyl-CoA dioxygenase family)
MINQVCGLTASEILSYEQDGYLRVKNLLDRSILVEYGTVITELTLALNEQNKPLAERDTYNKAFLQVMNLWQHSETVKRFVMGKRLAHIAAQLLQVKNVRIYHDQSLYKEPSGGITPAHADQYYWPLSSDKTITAWIPLQDVPLEMGPLSFYKGSHKLTIGRELEISDYSEEFISKAMADQQLELDTQPYLLGDVSFHSGWTFHKAGANVSKKPRSVMTIIYMDADIQVATPKNQMQHNDLKRWLPGLAPGDYAASDLNPLI